MNDIHRLIYTSVARPDLKLSDITSFLEVAQASNKRHGITGALVFANGQFLQQLEGTRSALTNIYGRIERDDRHSDLCLIDFRRFGTRMFEGWSMRHIGYRADLSLLDFLPHDWTLDKCVEFFSQYQASPSDFGKLTIS